MIFSISNHISQIINGKKTQTRRSSDTYQVDKNYSIQPCRTCKGITQGRILILSKTKEVNPFNEIDVIDAFQEGGYNPLEFEILYNKIHKNWPFRWRYEFKFIPTKEDKMT